MLLCIEAKLGQIGCLRVIEYAKYAAFVMEVIACFVLIRIMPAVHACLTSLL